MQTMIKRLAAGALALALACAPALAASVKVPLASYPGQPNQPVKATDTVGAPAPTTANASLNLPHGTAPSSPNNGDVWTTTAGVFLRVNGTTIGPIIYPTGSPTTGALAKFSGANSVTNGDLSGDVTTSGSTATTLANSGVTAGSYTCTAVTFDAKGRATGANNGSCPTVSGTPTAGDCVSWASSTSLQDAGAGCGGSAGLSPYYPSGGLTTPLLGNYTIAKNSSATTRGATATTTSRGVLLAIVNGGAGDPIIMAQRTYPGADFTYTIFVNPTQDNNDFIGYLFAQDNAGKIVVFGPRSTGGALKYGYIKWTSLNTYASEIDTTWPEGAAMGGPLWWRLQRSSGTFIVSISKDGQNFASVQSVSATDFLGATLSFVGALRHGQGSSFLHIMSETLTTP